MQRIKRDWILTSRNKRPPKNSPANLENRIRKLERRVAELEETRDRNPDVPSRVRRNPGSGDTRAATIRRIREEYGVGEIRPSTRYKGAL